MLIMNEVIFHNLLLLLDRFCQSDLSPGMLYLIGQKTKLLTARR